MGECRAAVDIAEGVDAFYIGFELVVYFDKAPFVGFDACFVKHQCSSLRCAAGCHQDVRIGESVLFTIDADMGIYFAIGLFINLGNGCFSI